MQSIGPYSVLRELARGGVGVVYEAVEPGLERKVAIKLLATPQADPGQLARFKREACATAQLRHPGIVALHTAGLAQGRPYLVMDLIEGESLEQRLKRTGPLEPALAVRLTVELARALHYAHGQGILHRDLKPANVLLDADERAILTDFGLAKMVKRDERLTKTGTILGTPSYLPPEQAGGRPDQVGPRSDVYGLGATLFSMLSGRPPFSGASLVSILNSVLTEAPPELSKLRDDLDPRLVSICMRCLAKEPGNRYPSAAAVADALEGLSVAAPRSKATLVPWVAGILVGALAGGAIAGLTRSGDRVTRPDLQDELDRTVARLQAAEQRQAEAIAERDRLLAARKEAPAKPDVKGLVQEAEQLLKAKEPEAALKKLDRAVSLNPDSAPAHAARGRAYYELRSYDLALDALSRAIELNPRDARSLYRRSTIYRRQEDVARALPDGIRANELRPRIARHLHNVIDLRLLCNDTEEAIAAARRACKLKPGSPIPYSFLVRALLDAGDTQEAADALEKSIGLCQPEDKFRQRLDELVEQLAKRDASLRFIGEGYASDDAKKSEEALAHYEEAARLDETNFEAWIRCARVHTRLRNHAAAVANLDVALGLKPGHVASYYARGVMLAALGRSEPAERDFERVVALAPKHALAANALGMINLRRGAFEEALPLFSVAVTAEAPGDKSGALINRAYIYVQLGQLPNALRDLEQAVRLTPREARAWATLSSVHTQLGDTAAALRAGEQAVAITPGMPEAWNNLAVARHNLGEFEAAVRDATRSLALRPKSSAAFETRGHALISLERWEEAVSDFQRGLEFEPPGTERAQSLREGLKLAQSKR